MLKKLLQIPRRILALAIELPIWILAVVRILFLASRWLFQLLSVSLILAIARLKKKIKGESMTERNEQEEIFSAEPEIPPRPGQAGTIPPTSADPGPIGGLSETAEDLRPLCEDLIAIPFDAWEMVSARPKALKDLEKSILGKRLARIIEKRPELKDKLTDELVFTAALIVAIGGRVKDERSYRSNNDSRKKGPGENDAGKVDHTAPPE